MVLARSLDGVISGEHGIGITKLEFLTDEELQPFADYKAQGRPEGRFNKGKLLRNQELHALAGQAPRPTRCERWPAADLTNAYTPSFGLMGHESLIMQQSDIGAIADSVKDCLRCGKCKPVCATHVPRANLLYSPRNKILATSLLVEAFLYEEQTRRGVSHHATGKSSKTWPTTAPVCHKCFDALPGEDRLWRCDHEHAQPAAQDGQEELPPRQRAGHDHAQRHQPRHHQAAAHGHGGRGLQGPAPGGGFAAQGGPQADRATRRPRWARHPSRSR